MRAGVSGALVLTAAIAALAIGASPASAAATRYASPSGSGDCSSPANACDIDTAAEAGGGVADGDEVVLAPGDYHPAGAGNALDISNAINLHGTPGQPKPRIIANGGGAVVRTGATFNGVHITDVEIEQMGSGIGLNVGEVATVDRVAVKSSGAVACDASNATLLRDTVCWATAGTGIAYRLTQICGGACPDKLADIRNLTAIANGSNGVALFAQAVSPVGVSATINGKNVIASGEGVDLDGIVSSTSTATIALDHSNFNSAASSVPPSTVNLPDAHANGNQDDPPAFVNAAAGDFHQTAGSPTVDAGTPDSALGANDLDGNPRTLDGKRSCTSAATPDIGAYELVNLNTIPPCESDTSIDKAPKRKSKKRTAKISFSSDVPGSTFECVLDKKPATRCTSPLTLKKLKPGKHTFQVDSVNPNSGKHDPTPATVAWKVKKRRKH